MPLPSLEVETRAACELVDVTARLEAALRSDGAADGALLVFCPHTTAGVTIQENADPDVRTDLLLTLENLVPEAPARGRYRHAEGNSHAHARAALVGSSVTLPVRGGALLLGTWQGVYLCEFDGPRRRTLHLQLLAARPAS
jgi:secondary thiamine-phosphate synthase enzyme